MTKIDLHMHSNISDGVLTPYEIIEEAVNNGVSVISITDHDIIDAYNAELFAFAKSKNIRLISGVEISTRAKGIGIHVLGYNFNLKSEKLNGALNKLRNSRHIYLHSVSNKLRDLGYAIHEKELDKIEAVTKAHIALDIVSNEDNKELLVKEFGEIPTKGVFIETIMNENCPAYVKKISITPKEAAQIIRAAGGKVVLAHPVSYQHIDNLSDESIIDIINEMKPDGIEANYLEYDREKNKLINESKKWNEVARKNELFSTVGSDFHKKEGIKPLIGFVNTEFSMSDEEINKIIYCLDN